MAQARRGIKFKLISDMTPNRILNQASFLGLNFILIISFSLPLTIKVVAQDNVGTPAVPVNSAPFFGVGSRPLRHRAAGDFSISGSFMFTDECLPPAIFSMTRWLVECEPYIDPVSARLHELLPILNQSRDVLRAARLLPSQPGPPSDSIGGNAILTPALIRRNQLEGIDRMTVAVNQVIAERRTAGRRNTRTSRATAPASAGSYASIIEGASSLRTILREEVRQNPNAQGQQAMLNNVDAVLRDLGTIVPRLASSPAEARQAYRRFVTCTQESDAAIVRNQQQEAEENSLMENGWRRYIECRRQQRARAAAARREATTAPDSEPQEVDPLLQLMPEELRRRYQDILRGSTEPTKDSVSVPAPVPPAASAQ